MKMAAAAASAPPRGGPRPIKGKATTVCSHFSFSIKRPPPPTNPIGKPSRRRIPSSPASRNKPGKSDDGDCSRDHSPRALANGGFPTCLGVLQSIDSGTFEAIYSWISESFGIIRTHVSSGFSEIAQSFPTAVDSVSRRLFTGLVLTKNMELFDDLRTFEELGQFLRSHGCHCGDDLERCCGSVLSDFILLLSEWAMKIPVILIIGAATTPDLLRSIIQSEALQCLCPFKFNLGTLAERMDAVVEAILVKQSPGFFISHKVGSF
ncbi:hypothetical protein NL676_016200 [Syzygium grande]|nr:hypothetical protein NL676_016200 [Syzygium grande]